MKTNIQGLIKFEIKTVSVYRARELIEADSSNLRDLLDCLINLSINKGYIQATKVFKIRNSDNAILDIKEIDFYLELIKVRIESKINGQI